MEPWRLMGLVSWRLVGLKANEICGLEPWGLPGLEAYGLGISEAYGLGGLWAWRLVDLTARCEEICPWVEARFVGSARSRHVGRVGCPTYAVLGSAASWCASGWDIAFMEQQVDEIKHMAMKRHNFGTIEHHFGHH